MRTYERTTGARISVGIWTALVLGLFASAWAADEPASVQGQWPCWRGPTCSGSATDHAGKLVDRPGQARLLWRSEEIVYSTYNGTCTGRSGLLASGCCSPVAADGRVYLYYYGPSQTRTVLNEEKNHRGETPEQAARLAYARDKYYREIVEMPEADYVRNKCNLVADDYVLCADANTGRTLWKAVFPAVTTFGKRATIHCVPCVDGGRVFVGTRYGSLVALDAKTGQVLWTRYNPGQLHKAKRNLVAAAEAKAYPVGAPFSCGVYHVMAADGVVFSSQAGGAALDAATGSERWAAKDARDRAISHSMPLRWLHKDKWYFILGGSCVEAATGKLCWQVERSVGTGGRGCGSPALSGQYVVYGSSRGEQGLTGPVCYRISADKAELVWAQPARTPMGDFLKPNTACTVSPCIHRGRVYVISRGSDQQRVGGTMKSCWLTVYDLETGKMVQEVEIAHPHGCTRGKPGAPTGGSDGCSSIFAFDGLICYRGAGKNAAGKLSVWRAIDSGVEFVELWQPEAFDVAHTPAAAGGRIYLRGMGRLLCYDLRKE